MKISEHIHEELVETSIVDHNFVERLCRIIVGLDAVLPVVLLEVEQAAGEEGRKERVGAGGGVRLLPLLPI